MDHQPEIKKIPPSLQSLEWVEITGEEEWSDGETILTAVPVCNNSNLPSQGWHYEFSVVRIRCDEHYFSIEIEDLPWGWELDSIDFFVRVTA